MPCLHHEWNAEPWPKPVAREVSEPPVAEVSHTILTCRSCGQRKVEWS